MTGQDDARPGTGPRAATWCPACGLLAPIAFVGAWIVAGSRTPGYSAVRDHISDLARSDASSRVLMTSGFVAFGLLLPVFALTLARALQVPALLVSVGLAGVSTLFVAAFPVDSHGGPHAAGALVGYLGTAASPLLAAAALPRPARLASYAVGVVSAAALTWSILGADQGLWQRTGLTVVDLWYAAMALRLLRRPGQRDIPPG